MTLCPTCLGRAFVYSPGGYAPKLPCPTCEDTSAEGCPILTLEPGVICDACDCWKGLEAERLRKTTENGA